MTTSHRLCFLLVACALMAGLSGCTDDARNESVKAANLGNSAITRKQFDEAIVLMKKAVELYPDNHLAWYGLGNSYLFRKEFKDAVDAYSAAVRIVDDQPMYHMWLGIALKMKATNDAFEDLAKRERKKVEEVDPDLSSINFESAIQHLQQAIKLRSEMWRAHYNLGDIYRDTEKAKEAAESFSKAISANPREQAPYVALAELYLRWGYVNEAIQVASQGTANVPGSSERSEIWFVLGMAYDAKQLDDKAIEAFGKALDDRRDNHKAKFQRGQAAFRKGDYVKAKRDLEDFAKTGSAKLALEKSQSTKILMDIAAKSAESAAPPQ